MYNKLTATGLLYKHQALLSRTSTITKYSLIQTTNKSVKIIKMYIFTHICIVSSMNLTTRELTNITIQLLPTLQRVVFIASSEAPLILLL